MKKTRNIGILIIHNYVSIMVLCYGQQKVNLIDMYHVQYQKTELY